MFYAIIWERKKTKRELDGDRDRQTERQRDRETERQRDRETEKQRDRETETDRHTDQVSLVHTTLLWNKQFCLCKSRSNPFLGPTSTKQLW